MYVIPWSNFEHCHPLSRADLSEVSLVVTRGQYNAIIILVIWYRVLRNAEGQRGAYGIVFVVVRGADICPDAGRGQIRHVHDVYLRNTTMPH